MPLLQASPMQIAFSDSHTVKPWFAGRLEFAPAVKDLAADGFPLAGARLDYIDGRRVAALVYRRRLHVVNVFLWPSTEVEAAPREPSVRDYNLISWRRAGSPTGQSPTSAWLSCASCRAACSPARSRASPTPAPRSPRRPGWRHP